MFVIPIAVFAIISFGLLSLKTPLFKNAKLQNVSEKLPLPKISIIIPARNEQARMPLLLESISNQSFAPLEVIVVDDESTDGTVDIANQYGAKVVAVSQRPKEFAPKAYACELGFQNSSGDILLFLDSDVVVSSDFVERIVNFFTDKDKQVLSIQPFHRTNNFVQSMSAFFHLASIVGSGLLSIIPFRVGLFGPCIAIRKGVYESCSGFANERVKSSYVEDLDMGQVLKTKGTRIDRYLGTGTIEYMMYSNFEQLKIGWMKNISNGATKTPFLVLVPIVSIIGSLISLPISIATRGQFSIELSFLAMQFLIVWLLVINVGVRLGTYFKAFLFFPISLFVFLYVFTLSLFAKITKKNVRWAGRELPRKLNG